MSYTWHDIKLATLQKMFSSNGTGPIQIDSSTKEYIESMPQAANEGLQLLSTAGKFIEKKRQIVVRPVENLLSKGFDNYFIPQGDKSFTAEGAKSYYFCVMGTHVDCTIVSGEVTTTITSPDEEYIESSGEFATFKGVIPTPGENATITFSSPYPYEVRNVCFYPYEYYTANDVPDYEEYLHYYLPDCMESFYQLAENDIYYQGKNGSSYITADEYYQEGDKTLVIPRTEEGVYTVYYKAYPEQITQDTEDDYILELDPEVAAILPLYMASQLYKDDDNSIATVYRNEFEVAFDRLSQKAKVPRKEEFVSETGWC